MGAAAQSSGQVLAVLGNGQNLVLLSHKKRGNYLFSARRMVLSGY